LTRQIAGTHFDVPRRLFKSFLAAYCAFISTTAAFGLHLDRDIKTGAIHFCADDCIAVPDCARGHDETCEYESLLEHLDESGLSFTAKLRTVFQNLCYLPVVSSDALELGSPKGIAWETLPYQHIPPASELFFHNLSSRAPPVN